MIQISLDVVWCVVWLGCGVVCGADDYVWSVCGTIILKSILGTSR
jgi:hypothetical protein